MNTRAISPAQIDTLYALYPRKVGKIAARRAIEKALRQMPFDGLLLAVERYRKLVARRRIEWRFIPYPATWFNRGHYDDADLAVMERALVSEKTEAEVYEMWLGMSEQFRRENPWQS